MLVRWTQKRMKCFRFLSLTRDSSCMLTSRAGRGGRVCWLCENGLVNGLDRESHFHFKGLSEAWHQQASLSALTRCTNACVHRCTRTHTHTHSRIIRSSRNRRCTTHTHNLPKSLVYSHLRKMRWYGFFLLLLSRLKNSQKLEKWNFKALCGGGYTLMNTLHTRTQTQTRRRKNKLLFRKSSQDFDGVFLCIELCRHTNTSRHCGGGSVCFQRSPVKHS